MAYNYGGYIPQNQMWQYQQPMPTNNTGYNPMPMQSQQNVGSFNYVMGIEGAKAFPIMPNQEIFLMDSQEPVAYIKHADMSGKQTLKIFDLVERTGEKQEEKQPTIDMSEYVKMSDLESVVSDAVDKAMASFTMTPTKAKRGASNV